MRGAFRSHSNLLMQNMHPMEDGSASIVENVGSSSDVSFWPTWDEVMELALDEDAESRLITHVPDDPYSWRLELGPFVDDQLASLDQMQSSGMSTLDQCKNSLVEPNEKWTLVLNDVDRFHPPLFDFITDTFSFIPEWRKDDGQST